MVQRTINNKSTAVKWSIKRDIYRSQQRIWGTECYTHDLHFQLLGDQRAEKLCSVVFPKHTKSQCSVSARSCFEHRRLDIFAILHKSCRWLTPLSLCRCVCLPHTKTHSGMRRNSPAAACCSILNLLHANTCSTVIPLTFTCLPLCSHKLSPQSPQRILGYFFYTYLRVYAYLPSLHLFPNSHLSLICWLLWTQTKEGVGMFKSSLKDTMDTMESHLTCG